MAQSVRFDSEDCSLSNSGLTAELYLRVNTSSRFYSLFLLVTVSVASFAQAEPKATEHINFVREQIRQGLNFAGGAKAAVTEYFYKHQKMPVDNYEAGLTDSFNIGNDVVISVSVSDGEISVTFGGAAAAELSGRVIALTPFAKDGRIHWECAASYIDDRYLPAPCRRSKAQPE